VDTAGLTSETAAQRLIEVGRNEVASRTRVTVSAGLAQQLRDPLILVLLGACLLTLLTGDVTDALVIAVVVTANTTVGLVQEIRADRAIIALAHLSAPFVRVRRDGVEVSVAAADVVPGDAVLLAEGDVVPADGELIEASSVLVDESAMTGESVPVRRRCRSEAEAGEDLSAGTVVVKGRAVILVSRTGAGSALGQIAALTDSRLEPTPLQLRLADLGRVLALVAVGLSVVVLVLGLVRGQPFELMMVTAISLAVAAVPESLPAVVTLALALGARRMASRHAIVRRLPAVETLGSVAVLATDKTGTLTQARMVVGRIWTPAHTVTVTGDGYEPQGELFTDGVRLEPGAAPDVMLLLRAMVLCNDAALVPPPHPGAAWRGLGDPTEAALLAAGGKVGLTRSTLTADYPRVAELPFDSGAQRMTTVHTTPPGQGNRRLVVVKGSPEAVHAAAANGVADQVDPLWERMLTASERYAREGFRVLAVTAGPVDDGAAIESASLQILGLVAINDPAKPAARDTITACREAGIVPVMITGDHPATAWAIARDVGILSTTEAEHPELLVTGAQMANGMAGDLTIPRVFARTSPAQKLAIIQAWKDRGASIAMTGDGVNDGPALRRADVGVAMGHRGTEIARQAADLVLADDELATLIPAVNEGRRVYANIRKFLVFGLSGGGSEIAIMLVAPLFGLTVPLLAAQILWINLLTHGLTGVAIGAEPASASSMARPPRPPEQSVLGEGLWQRVLAIAAVITAVTMGVGLWAHATDRPWRSLIFLSLVALQLGVALGLRGRLFTRQNPFLPLAVAASLLLALAGLYIPLLRELLDTQSLDAFDALVGVATGGLGWAAARLTDAHRPGRTRGTFGSVPTASHFLTSQVRPPQIPGPRGRRRNSPIS
jgi:Ca2+-transporting ATPase